MAGEEAVSGRDYLRLVGVAALLGIPAALLAAGFLKLVHELQDVLWDDLPDALGHTGPPWYLVVGLPVAGAVPVIVARRFLPGDGGHRPLEGIGGAPTLVSYVPGVLVAALGSLGFGLVLGPEAPVVAFGSAVGLGAARLARLDERGTAVMALAGSFSAISALFGGPLVGGVLLLEGSVGLGAAAVPALAPGFVAAALGYTLFVGARHVGGLAVPGLAVPGLAVYDGTRIVDLVLAVVVGLATSLAVAFARALARGVESRGVRLGTAPLMLLGGLVVGVIAQASSGLGADATDVLFSGQDSVPDVVAEESFGVVLVLLVAKLLAYAVSMGAGFRGGPIFPAVFLGVAVATLAVVAFDSSATWAIAVGASAGMAAEARLLVAPLLFGTLLVGGAGADAAPASVLAAVTAWIVAEALDRRAAAAAGAGQSA